MNEEIEMNEMKDKEYFKKKAEKDNEEYERKFQEKYKSRMYERKKLICKLTQQGFRWYCPYCNHEYKEHPEWMKTVFGYYARCEECKKEFIVM